MRSFLAAIAAALSRMASTATRMVRRAGQWVLELVDIGGSPAPVPPMALPEPQQVDDVAALKRVAGVLAQRKTSKTADLRGVTDRQLKWLRELDRLQLCRVIAAEPDRVRAHLLGRQLIRGVPAADDESVAQLKSAREADRRQAMLVRSDMERREAVEREIRELETGSPMPAM